MPYKGLIWGPGEGCPAPKILKILLLLLFCDIFRSPREKYVEQEKSGLKIAKTIVSSRKYSSKPYFPLGWKTNGRVQVNSRFCVLHNYQLEQYRTHHNTCNTWMVLTVQGRSIFTIASILWIKSGLSSLGSWDQRRLWKNYLHHQLDHRDGAD